MKHSLALSTLLGSLLVTGGALADDAIVITADDVDWGYLNPARGDKSPGAADLWGDRTKDVATGMLVKFKKGFSSPPHIHNITYRAIVIEGKLHNDDPEAEEMWMPAGSYWQQPAGESHVTAAQGQQNMAYLEINQGPYLVEPTEKAFDNGERPINIDVTNMAWQASQTSKVVGNTNARYSILWAEQHADNQRYTGAMLKIPAGSNLTLNTSAPEFRAVVIGGELDYKSDDDGKNLAPGSYFSSQNSHQHIFTATQDTQLLSLIHI